MADVRDDLLAAVEKWRARAETAESSLRAQAALALDRLKRIGRLEDDLQRIRIVATAGNPMSPKRAALCMSQIDEIARVVLAATKRGETNG